MRSHIGESFDGTVTALVGTGLFVALDDPFVDVLVRMESLGADKYEADDEGLRVIGVRSGDRIGLGDRMRVQIEDVAILRRSVYGRRLVGPDDARAARPRAEPERAGKPEKKTRGARGVREVARVAGGPSKKPSKPGKKTLAPARASKKKKRTR
jgi:ribonuclease R